MWASDHLHTDDFTDATSSLCAASVAALTAATSPVTKLRDQAATDLVPTQKLHVGSLHHGVGRFDQRETKPLVSIMPNASEILAILVFSPSFRHWELPLTIELPN